MEIRIQGKGWGRIRLALTMLHAAAKLLVNGIAVLDVRGNNGLPLQR